MKKSTLTVRFNPENAGTAKITRGTTGWSNGGYIGHGSEQTISATPQGHYKFVSWTSESGEVLSSEQEYAFTMPEKDLLLTANFEEHYDPANPGDPSPEKMTTDPLPKNRLSSSRTKK